MKEKLKQYALNEIKEFRSGLTIAEYILWWIMRLCMIGMIIYNKQQNREAMVLLMMRANLIMMFMIPMMRIVFFKKIFFGKLPYRIQTFIDIFVFAGSFLGHGLDFNGTVDNYDKFMHMVSGGLVVFIGYLVLTCIKTGNELSPALKTFGAGGFSCLVMIVWEIFEFICDFIIDKSCNQNFHFVPEDDYFFFKIFGQGAGKTGQYPLLDTDIDIFLASVGCIGCMAILYTYLKLRDRCKLKKVKN